MAVLGHNITASPEERAGKRALAFMDVNTFKNMYYALHTEAADRFVNQARSPDDPAKLSQEQLNAPLSKAGEEQSNIMDQFSSPGELMIVYGPFHSPEVEKIFEEFNKSFLASLNDPTINSAATENLSERIYAYQQDIFDEYPEGMSEEEKRQKKHFEEMSNLMESYAQMEEEQMRLEKWNNETHNFGGMQISGEDLQKIFDFLKDPANRAKVEDKMRQDGVDEETIQKGREEMDEYRRLEEIKKKRKLTEEEQRRWDEIQKSDAYRKYAQSTAEIAQKYGIDLPSLKNRTVQDYAASEKEYLSKDFEIYSKQATNSSITHDEWKTSFKEAQQPTEQQAQSVDTSMKSSWKVVDMKQAFQDNNKTTFAVAPKLTASNIELIQENKTELLEPTNKPLHHPVQVATVAPSNAGFSL